MPTEESSSEQQRGPLRGIRVVELSLYVQGPIAGAMLGYLGADVIKIEPTGGEPSRGFTTVNGIQNYPHEINWMWSLCNPNKESIELDLRVPEQRAQFHELIRGADVFLTNLQVPTLAKYGADQATLEAINPAIVYARAGGFGYEGPRGGDPCQDTVGMAYAGMMDSCSPWDDTPSYPLGNFSDVLSGTMLACGIAISLLNKSRNGATEAGMVETSQLQTLMWLQMFHISAAATFGKPLPRHRRTNPQSAVFNTYEGSDGQWLALGLIKQSQWEEFAVLAGLAELATDARFATPEARAENGEELAARISGSIRQRSRDEWLAVFRAARLWVAPVNRMMDLIDDEQVLANGLIVGFENGVKTSALPFTIGDFVPPTRLAPRLNSFANSLAAHG